MLFGPEHDFITTKSMKRERSAVRRNKKTTTA
jgi:hypothetical protein